MKRIYYILSLLTFLLSFIIIGWHLNFLVLAGAFLVIGAVARFWGGEKFSLYVFVFLLPFINASPALVGSTLPYNYTAPALFLLCGILIPGTFPGKDSPERNFSLTKVFGPTFFQKGRPPEADFYYYYLFLILFFISTLFVFLHWSNITLGNMAAIGADTPVSAPLPRLVGNSILWIEQRVSSAIIFPVISLFLYFISPYIFFYIQAIKPGEKTVFKWLSFGFYISTALAGLQKIVGQSHLSDRLGKGFKQFNGGFSDFNALGVFAGMMFLWSTYEIKKKNVLGYVTLGVSLIGGILSGSRTMVFFAAAGMINLLTIAFKNREKKQKWMVWILIAVFLVLIIFAGGTLKKRLMGADWDAKETLFDKFDAMVNGRLKMAVFSLKIIRDYFFTGVGTGNYTFYLSYRNYLPYKDSGKEYLYDLPMNQYLWIFVENGFAAFLFFTFFLVLLYRRSNKKLLTGTILVVLLFNNFFWFPEAFLLFWILAAFSYTGKLEETPNIAGTPVDKKRRLTAAMALVILILANVVLFNKLHPKTWAKETGIRYDYGVWPAEKDADGTYFNWTKDRAGVYLKLDNNGESRPIKITCGFPFHLASKEQKVKIYWKGKQEREIIFTSNETIEFKIKSLPFAEGILEVRVYPVFNPKKLGMGTDSRNLGVRYSL